MPWEVFFSVKDIFSPAISEITHTTPTPTPPLKSQMVSGGINVKLSFGF